MVFLIMLFSAKVLPILDKQLIKVYFLMIITTQLSHSPLHDDILMTMIGHMSCFMIILKNTEHMSCSTVL